MRPTTNLSRTREEEECVVGRHDLLNFQALVRNSHRNRKQSKGSVAGHVELPYGTLVKQRLINSGTPVAIL